MDCEPCLGHLMVPHSTVITESMLKGMLSERLLSFGMMSFPLVGRLMQFLTNLDGIL